MKNVLLTVIAFFATIPLLSSSPYKINDEELNQMFNVAEESTDLNMNNVLSVNLPNASQSMVYEKDPWVAFALSMVFYVTGISGLHRIYLGSGAGVFIAYLLTGGGCGILQIVDTVVLFLGALDGDISQYIDNKKLFMW